MTVEELAAKYGYKIATGSNENLKNDVSGVYACDLLSHAMAKVNSGDAWVTVHTNLNVVAVASLTDAACVIIPENIEIEQATLEKAVEKGVVFLSTSKSAAHICHEVLSALEKGL
ncbi:MAG: hypothetical protein GXX10_11990 [Clostridiaceae bacterium]|nr:hypothetical protein [Clostridiaceae bacterium]